MEGKDKVAKLATSKSSRAGKDSRQVQNSAPQVGAASEKKRKAATRRPGNTTECDIGRGSNRRDAEDTHSSSDSESDCGEDELQFVCGVNSDDVRGGTLL